MRRSKSTKRASDRSASNCGSMANSVICVSRSAKAVSRFSKALAFSPQVGINDGETVRTDISLGRILLVPRKLELPFPVATLALRS